MTWVDWMVHGIAIFILAGWFGAPDAILDGDYRLTGFIFFAAACAWGWIWEHLQRQQEKVPNWEDRPPRPKPVAWKEPYWWKNEVPTRDASRLDEHPLWTEDDEDTRREPRLLHSN